MAVTYTKPKKSSEDHNAVHVDTLWGGEENKSDKKQSLRRNTTIQMTTQDEFLTKQQMSSKQGSLICLIAQCEIHAYFEIIQDSTEG